MKIHGPFISKISYSNLYECRVGYEISLSIQINIYSELHCYIKSTKKLIFFLHVFSLDFNPLISFLITIE